MITTIYPRKWLKFKRLALLVFFCCVTNTTILAVKIFCHNLEDRKSRWIWLVVFSRSHKTKIKVSAILASYLQVMRVCRGQGGRQEEVCASKCIQVAGRIQFFVAVGMRSPFSFWLLGRNHSCPKGCPHFFSYGPLTSSKPARASSPHALNLSDFSSAFLFYHQPEKPLCF